MRLIFWILLLGPACGEKALTSDEGEPSSTALPSDDLNTPDADDTGGAGDTGEAEETGEPPGPAHLQAADFSGEMETTYVYSGSLGGWDDSCTGPVTLTINDTLALSGEGDCQFEAWGMGFLIEGQQTDTAVEGLLISDNALGRVETPFTGTRNDATVELTFDTVHETDGESVQLLGTITVMVVQ